MQGRANLKEKFSAMLSTCSTRVRTNQCPQVYEREKMLKVRYGKRAQVPRLHQTTVGGSPADVPTFQCHVYGDLVPRQTHENVNRGAVNYTSKVTQRNNYKSYII
jgi:hypothetical protein